MDITRFASIALIVLGLAAGQAHAETHEHHGHAGGAPALQLNNGSKNGSKWATDQPLRQGMNRIHAAFNAKFPAILAGKLAPQGYAALAQIIQTEIAGIVRNCKLDKQADAMLHLVLADLIEGAEAMQGKNAALKPRDGALKVEQALKNYGSFFDHPGWGGE